MSSLPYFAAHLKMRHDYSDMIQVRYTHTDGETYDTWVSGEEVESRLKTMSREQLIRSFSTMNWDDAKTAVSHEIDQAKQKRKKGLRDRLADKLQDNLGGNLFGDTLADNVRGVDSNIDSYDQEKQQWQAKLTERPFRAVAIELAWFNLKDSLPDTPSDDLDDWL